MNYDYHILVPVGYLGGFRDILERGPCPVGALFAEGGVGGVGVDGFWWW